MNKFIGNFEEGEVYVFFQLIYYLLLIYININLFEVLSSTILHVIGVRSKVEDSIVRAGAATESLIQIIHV